MPFKNGVDAFQETAEDGGLSEGIRIRWEGVLD